MPMQGQRGRSGRRGGVLLDMVHLAVGIGIVILAVTVRKKITGSCRRMG